MTDEQTAGKESYEPDSLVQPSQATTTTAIAFRPEMLKLLLCAYKRNIEMTPEEGGVSGVDYINAIIQERLTLGNMPERQEHRLIVECFEKAREENGTATCQFYACNPFPIGVTGVKSTINPGAEVTDDMLRQGKPHQAFPKEIVSEIRDIMKELEGKNPAARPEACKIIDDAVKRNLLSPADVLNQLRIIQNGNEPKRSGAMR